MRSSQLPKKSLLLTLWDFETNVALQEFRKINIDIPYSDTELSAQYFVVDIIFECALSYADVDLDFKGCLRLFYNKDTLRLR